MSFNLESFNKNINKSSKLSKIEDILVFYINKYNRPSITFIAYKDLLEYLYRLYIVYNILVLKKKNKKDYTSLLSKL